MLFMENIRTLAAKLVLGNLDSLLYTNGLNFCALWQECKVLLLKP